MPSIYSRPSFPSTFLQALWRLVRMLFGGGRRVEDAESGNGVPVKACSMSPRPPPNYLPSDTFIFLAAPDVGAKGMCITHYTSLF
jgi:hypothetical protein